MTKVDHLVLRDGSGRMVGSAAFLLRPDRSAFVWPPAVVTGRHPGETAGRLMGDVLARLAAAGCRFAQCLLDADDRDGRAVMTSAGFRRVAEVSVREWRLPKLRTRAWELGATSQESGVSGQGSAGRSQEPGSSLIPHPSSFIRPDTGRLQLTTHQPALRAAVRYDPQLNRERFARLLESTWEGSLDGPELIGLRTAEETLFGFQSDDGFNPALWTIFQHKGRDAGILLMAERPDAREISYLGVAPAFRGRGFGRDMLHFAADQALRAGTSRLLACVDSSNRYAVDLYNRMGFKQLRLQSLYARIISLAEIVKN